MSTFSHKAVYDANPDLPDFHSLPRVFLSPPKYIQGPKALQSLGRYLQLILKAKVVGVLITKGGEKRSGNVLYTSLESQNIQVSKVYFQGETSLSEIQRVTEEFKANEKLDCVVGIGGGKLVDAAKYVAQNLAVPVVICPSIASNDAPCSALSVMYTEEGTFCGIEYYPQNPVMVVVDTDIIANSPPRTLVSGMGDALATW